MGLKIKDIDKLVRKGFISKIEKQALDKLVAELKTFWPESKGKVFGSKVKGTSDEESDLDILILLPNDVTKEIRQQIIHRAFDINLQFGTNISTLIMSEKEWNSDLFSSLPIHSFIEEEGVPL